MDSFVASDLEPEILQKDIPFSSFWNYEENNEYSDNEESEDSTLMSTTAENKYSSQVTEGENLCEKGFSCNNGQCIFDYWRCDGDNDCDDRSDEEGCEYTVCTDNELKCPNGRCILKSWKCNGIEDCPDGSDEINCDNIVSAPLLFALSSRTLYEYPAEFLIDKNKETCTKLIPRNPRSIKVHLAGEKNIQSVAITMLNTDKYLNFKVDVMQKRDGMVQYKTCTSFTGKFDSPTMTLTCKDVVGVSGDTVYIEDNDRIGYLVICEVQVQVQGSSIENDVTTLISTTEENEDPSLTQVSKGENPNILENDDTILMTSTKENKDSSLVKERESPKVLNPYRFRCDNGKEFSSQVRCDTYDHCGDGSDEKGCDKHLCNPNQFRCESGQCINETYRCNIYTNCADESDEYNCSCDNGFLCKNGRCIHDTVRCNEYDNCGDGSDEEDCDKTVCKVNQFRCPSGRCLKEKMICDGYNHCSDSSDEKNCGLAHGLESEDTILITTTEEIKDSSLATEGETLKVWESEIFLCDNGIRYHIGVRCDEYDHCGDGSDEKDCDKNVCNHNQFRCDNGQCIDEVYRCDIYKSCNDGSDEKNCSCDNGFLCNNGKCILDFLRCFGWDHCGDGSDEEDCEKTVCKVNQFRCPSGRCIRDSWVCDNYNHCPDGSDEKNCAHGLESEDTILITTTEENKDTFQVTEGVRLCEEGFSCNNDICVHHSWRCDGEDDCGDGSDEEDCDKTVCRGNQFRCSSGRCIPESLKCDGIIECPDSSDEKNCVCMDGFNCSNGVCISKWEKCDYTDDCGDGSDEKNCCEDDEFSCNNGECFLEYFKCNGYSDCPDGSDEENCHDEETTLMSATEENKDLLQTQVTVGKNHCGEKFSCNNGECIYDSWRCDGDDDCDDRSDEEDCDDTFCTDNKFWCRSEGCIPVSRKCDKFIDCPDGSDEKNCGNDEDTENSFLFTNEESTTESATHSTTLEKELETTTEAVQPEWKDKLKLLLLKAHL